MKNHKIVGGNAKQQTNKLQMKANQPIEIIGSYQVNEDAWQELTKERALISFNGFIMILTGENL